MKNILKIVIYWNIFAAIIASSQVHAIEKTKIQIYDKYIDTDIAFFDKNNNKLYLDKFENKTLLLVFWATWCGGCVDEILALDNLQKDFSKLPFKVIALSQDYQGVEASKNFFNSHQIRHLNIYYDNRNQLFRAFNVVGLPTAFLINSDGMIKIAFQGRVKWYTDEVRKVLLTHIENNPPLPKNSFKEKPLNKYSKASQNEKTKNEDKKTQTEDEKTKNEDEKMKTEDKK